MSTGPTINGERLAIRAAMRMEDCLEAFAVRAACFAGELGVPLAEEFDGHEFDATHLVAYLGAEPVGAVRVRWFGAFAMAGRLAVIRPWRGRGIGRLLLERCGELAAGRGCKVLHAQVLPHDVEYWEKQGWQRLGPSGAERIVAMARAVDPATTPAEDEVPRLIALRRTPPGLASN